MGFLLGYRLGLDSTLLSPNGSPSSLTLTVDSDTAITGSFTIGSTNQDGHYVYMSSDNGVTYAKTTVTWNTTSNFTKTGLTENTTYYFYVVAYKGSKESVASNVVKVIDAFEFGFKTTSSATENTTAFNSIGINDIVKVTTAGTFEINNTLWLESNTTYWFKDGCTIKKATGSSFSHIFANKGMLTLERDEHINFYGNNINIDANGIDVYSVTDANVSPVFRLRAQIQFYKLDNFIFDGIYGNNPDILNQYFLCFCDCHYGEISNVETVSEKDALDIISCTDLNFNTLNLTSRDDNIFFGVGYYSSTPFFGDTSRINITGLTIGYKSGDQGYITRFYCASWKEFVAGTSYDFSEVVSNNGHIYQKGGGSAPGQFETATIPPTHLSGEHTGLDGISWWYLQPDAIDHVSVTDIVIKDITINGDRSLCDLSSNTISVGTELLAINDNITFDNVIFPETYTKQILTHQAPTGEITIKNTTIDKGSVVIIGTIKSNLAYLNNVIFDNCILTLTNILLHNGYRNQNYELKKITVLNSELSATGQGLYYFRPTPKLYNSLELINTNINGITRLIYFDSTGGGAYNIKLNNCEFKTALEMLISNTLGAGNSIIYSSDMVKYIDPSVNLFYNNQNTGDVTITLTNSTGTVTPTKVRNSNKVVVVSCDLPYV